jgi:NDP-sugar pyrophosphorylase family protein
LLRDDLLLVMNGDSYLEADLSAFIELHWRKGATCSMALTHVSDTARYGRVETDKNQMVLRFIEKGTDQGPGTINAGIYLFDRRIIEGIPHGTEVSLEREVLPTLIGDRFYGFPNSGRFIDIGTPKSYQEAEWFFTNSGTHLSAFSA